MKTIRRDQLRRLAESGRLELVSSYHFDDMYGQSGGDRKEPVEMIPADRTGCREGVCYVFPSDFRGNCGHASLNPDGTIYLHIHSNRSYTFRVKAGNGPNPIKTPMAKRPENVRMQAFLSANGIDAVPKYLPDGSLRGCWRLYNSGVAWSLDLAAKLNALGFVDFDGQPLGEFSGNGGSLSVFVRGHNELLQPSD